MTVPPANLVSATNRPDAVAGPPQLMPVSPFSADLTVSTSSPFVASTSGDAHPSATIAVTKLVAAQSFIRFMGASLGVNGVVESDAGHRSTPLEHLPPCLPASAL